jgi:pilus assembly protein CpaC
MRRNAGPIRLNAAHALLRAVSRLVSTPRPGTLLVSLALCGSLAAQAPATASRDLVVTVGKSVLVDSPAIIERVSVANGDLAEAVPINPREILVNGKMAGETSLIVWQQGGNRLFFDVTVRRNDAHLDAVRRELAREMGNDEVSLELEGESVFLRGTVPDLVAADRAVAIAATLGKTVNLLRVNIPGTDQQILLKVRFADVDRSAVKQLGVNLVGLGAAGNTGSISTGQFTPPRPTDINNTGTTTFTLSDALNIFLFRPDLNLGATIKALQSESLLQILAEPNVLAINGHQASFLAGGEFPYPTLQGGGGGLGAVTIQFREFGVRINFTPTVTPRGSIRLTVTPEVSSLDVANGLVFQGFTIPALSVRRVVTEVELEDGQSFAIGGLLDNRTTETLNKIPGLGDIPFFGKLFRSKQANKSNTELLVMVTPEMVRPIPKDQSRPELNFPQAFMPPNTPGNATRTPGIGVTGAETPRPPATMPVEQLVKSQQSAAGTTGASTPQPYGPVQFMPVPLQPQAQPVPAAPPPAAAPAKPAANER